LSNCFTAKAASAAFAQDVGAGLAQHTAPTGSSSPAATSSSRKPGKSGGISDYSTPESLGYTDPDIERARAEAERRRTQGVVGDWHFVESTPAEPPSGTEETTQIAGDAQNPAGHQETSNKRPVPEAEEDDEGRWKLRKKTTTIGLGEIYDPGLIAIKLKAKVEVKGEEAVDQDKQPATSAAVPKWAPVKWKKAGELADDTDGAASSAPASDATSTEAAAIASLDLPNANADRKPTLTPAVDVSLKEEPLPVTLQDSATPSGETGLSQSSLFRKRKAPVGGGSSSRGRRF
jgi:WW domain-binding protein 4